jgi:hypothetical protein
MPEASDKPLSDSETIKTDRLAVLFPNYLSSTTDQRYRAARAIKDIGQGQDSLDDVSILHW